MEIKTMKLTDLIPYENNPRNNDGAVEYVANSINQFGFKVPIVVDKNNVIVAGHTRYLAAERLGLDEVPVIIADDLTDKQIKAYRLADNKTAERASWDFEKLTDEIADIEMDFNLPDFGFGEFELDVLKNGEDFDEEEFDDLPAETAKVNNQEDGVTVTITAQTEEEEEWLRSILCVDKLKRKFTCSELMEGEA